MRSRKTSSGDLTTDPYKYLHHIPSQQRTRLNGKIVRTGTLKGGSHRDVKLIENGVVIFHGKQ
jgi:hypothetical protein